MNADKKTGVCVIERARWSLSGSLVIKLAVGSHSQSGLIKEPLNCSLGNMTKHFPRQGK